MSSPQRFVLRKQNFLPSSEVEPVFQHALPDSFTVLESYRLASDAEAARQELLQAIQRKSNPFQFGGQGLHYQTSMPGFVFKDYLLDLGLTPPGPGQWHYYWWKMNQRNFTADQRAAIWAACDKIPLYDVVEENDRTGLHLVVKYIRDDTGEHVACRPIGDGGTLATAHRTIRSANRALSEEVRYWQRITFEDESSMLVDLPDPEVARRVCLPLVGEHDGEVVYILTRRSLLPQGGFDFSCEYHPASVPLVAFGSIEDAENARQHRIRQARQRLNPIAVLARGELSAQHLLGDADETKDLPNGLSFAEACDVVRKLKMIPPPEDLTPAWYDHVVQWMPEFIDPIWSAFADFLLYEIHDVPLEP